MNNEEKFMKAPHWYVIRPTFRGEIRCADEMKAAEIEHFLPMYGRWTLVRHTKGRRKEVRLPLLPGYLFGRLSGDDFTKLHDRPPLPPFRRDREAAQRAAPGLCR